MAPAPGQMTSASSQTIWCAVFGTQAEDVRLDFDPGGVVLFRRNLDPDPGAGPAQCHALVRGLQARWGREALLAVALDQEGDTVSRLRPWTGPTPSLRTLWTRGGPAACQLWGGLWGRGLALLGFNVDFAPVADLWDPGGTAAIADRAASAEPLEAAAAAGAFLHGLEEVGVSGCLKHYPGLGGLALDSHQGLPERTDAAGLERHVLPFRILTHPDRLAMVAHLRLPGTGGLPASLSRTLVADNPWGIRARWLPDDLEMGGCADWNWDDRVRLCLEAGHQALLVCQTPEGVDACARAVEKAPEALWWPALEQFLAQRRRLPRGAETFDREAWGDWIRDVRASV
jgi:beta-N-acetylhexosaminidase